MTDANNIWDEVPDWGGIGARRLARAGSGVGASIWVGEQGRFFRVADAVEHAGLE